MTQELKTNLKSLVENTPNDQELGELARKLILESDSIIQFLEYEEALTKDPATASRIKKLLIKLKIWS